MNEADIKNILLNGETEQIEFKLNFGSSTIISVNAFANTKGGRINIGVDDEKRIVGIETNTETLQNWINEIKNKTYPPIIPDVEICKVNSRNIVVICVDEFPIKPVALKGRYYKRVKNSNHQMSISEIANSHLKTVNSSWDFSHASIYSVEDLSEEIKIHHIED